MTNTPYSWSEDVNTFTGVWYPIVADVETNEGPAGGQYETIGGYRIRIELISGSRLYRAAVGVGQLAPNFPYLDINQALEAQYDGLMKPGDCYEYGVAPAAYEGTYPNGGFGTAFIAFLTVDYEPAKIRARVIQTDPAVVLSY